MILSKRCVEKFKVAEYLRIIIETINVTFYGII